MGYSSEYLLRSFKGGPINLTSEKILSKAFTKAGDLFDKLGTCAGRIRPSANALKTTLFCGTNFSGRRRKKKPWENWVNRFITRYPILKTQRPRRIKNARVNGATTEVIKSWWFYLKNPVIDIIKPANRWNMDETNTMEGKNFNSLVLKRNKIWPL